MLWDCAGREGTSSNTLSTASLPPAPPAIVHVEVDGFVHEGAGPIMDEIYIF